MEVRSEKPFSVSMQKNPVAAQTSMSGMRLTVTPDGTAVYKPITATTPIGTGTMEVRSEQPFSVSTQKSPVAAQTSMSGMRLTVTPDGTAVYKPITATTPIVTGTMEVRSEQPFSVSTQKNPVAPQTSMSGMRLTVTPDGTAVYKPITATAPTATMISSSSPSPFYGGSVGATVAGSDGASVLAAPAVTLHRLNVGTGESFKKKRGRPKKYGPDGSMALALTTVSPSSAVSPGLGGFSPLSMGKANTDLSVSGDPMKKVRGRPPGSGKKQQLLALGAAGTGFTPHVITVRAGEDVSSKIMSFSQHGPRTICILSANGAISNVTLRQAATSGGTVTYEGRFEILSLSGSFLLSESGGQRSRTGGLSVSLAGPDGRVLGGGVAGLLMAASPVQVVVGSFIADGKKNSKHVTLFDGLSAMGKLITPGGGFSGGVTTGGSSPPSQGTMSESSGGGGSPLNQSTGTFNTSNQQGLSGISWK